MANKVKPIRLPHTHRDITRPIKQYKNLQDFRMRGADWFVEKKLVDNPDKWPCLECHGKAWIYDPEDEPCPIEGYKMVSRIRCPACKGTGFGPKELVVKAYRQIVSDHKDECRKFDERVKLYKEVIATLSDKEIGVLKAFWC